MKNLLHSLEPLWGVWKIDEWLGDGSFGQVWQVNRTDGEGVHYAALKIVKVSFSTDDFSAARMEGLTYDGAKIYLGALMKETLNEIEIMRELAECENTVRFHKYQVTELTDDKEFGWLILILMERLVPFKTRFLQNGFTVDDVAHLGTNIAAALEFCEKHGIVHKDIKPDNLFYSPEENQYKLGDFGIAHYLTSPSGGKGRAGTFTHMPPEVYHGSPFTPSSDLYALGMILYRLLNDNRIPFLPPFPEPFTPAQREQALMRRLDGEQIEPPSIIRYSRSSGIIQTGLGAGFSEKNRGSALSLGEIAQRAISANPENRFTSAKELRIGIQNAVDQGE